MKPWWQIKYKRIIEEENNEVPPESVWMNIEDRLDVNTVWENIHDELDTEEVWSRIESVLLAENNGEYFTGTKSLYRYVPAAAVILLLLGTGFFLNRYFSQRPLSSAVNEMAETKEGKTVNGKNTTAAPQATVPETNQTVIPLKESGNRLAAGNPASPEQNGKKPDRDDRKNAEHLALVPVINPVPDRNTHRQGPGKETTLKETLNTEMLMQTANPEPEIPELQGFNGNTDVSGNILTMEAGIVAQNEETKRKRPEWYAGITIHGENNWLLNSETFTGLQRNTLISTNPDFSAHYEFSGGVRIFKGWYLGTSLFLTNNVGQNYKTYINGRYTKKNLRLRYSGVNVFLKYSKHIILTGYSNTRFNTYLGMFYHNLRAAEEQIGTLQVNRNREFRNADYGIVLGNELDIPAGKGYHFMPGLRIKYGLPNIYSGNGTIPSSFNLTHTFTFELSLGMNFNSQRKF